MGGSESCSYCRKLKVCRANSRGTNRNIYIKPRFFFRKRVKQADQAYLAASVVFRVTVLFMSILALAAVGVTSSELCLKERVDN